MKKPRRNPKWPFDRPQNIEAVDLDPANLYRRLMAGRTCMTQSCHRTLDRITEPDACMLCQSVVEYMDSLPEGARPESSAPKRRSEHLLETVARMERERRKL